MAHPSCAWKRRAARSGRLTASGINLAADGNRDGVVDNLDYNVWRANFGQTVGSGSAASANTAVPEPATKVLLMFAAAGWCLRRRRDE